MLSNKSWLWKNKINGIGPELNGSAMHNASNNAAKTLANEGRCKKADAAITKARKKKTLMYRKLQNKTKKL